MVYRISGLGLRFRVQGCEHVCVPTGSCEPPSWAFQRVMLGLQSNRNEVSDLKKDEAAPPLIKKSLG